MLRYEFMMTYEIWSMIMKMGIEIWFDGVSWVLKVCFMKLWVKICIVEFLDE
jgi:hypothetical protein